MSSSSPSSSSSCFGCCLLFFVEREAEAERARVVDAFRLVGVFLLDDAGAARGLDEVRFVFLVEDVRAGEALMVLRLVDTTSVVPARTGHTYEGERERRSATER